MTRALCVCLALVVSLAAAPLFAGTVYVPILSSNGVDGTKYITRISLTNEGNGPLTVETLFLGNYTDGTKGREDGGKAADKTTVRAGDTVILEVDSGSGILEITTVGDDSGALAISAELRRVGQNNAMENVSAVPVVTSENTAGSGQSLTLQGLRRTVDGVYTNLLLVNLGHDPTQCSVKVVKASGQQIGGTALLSLQALSQAQFNDALDVLGQSQIRDVHARIECDQAFFAYLTTYEREGGKALLIQPSATGDSGLGRPGDNAPSVPGALVFSKSGAFHTATPAEPTAIFNIPVPKNHSYSKVVVDVDIFHGGWSSQPAGFHNLMWLHRGACCWPSWPDNVFGLVETRGPGLNRVAVKTNVNMGPHDQLNFFRVVPLLEGNTYHLRYEYDGANRAIRFVISQAGQVVGQGVDRASANSIRTDSSGFFMIYFGHEPSEFDQPSYGWKYQNLRVEFLP